MKVLHVITGLGQGGAEGCLVRLVLADPENTHIVVSLLDEGIHGAALREGGIRVHSLCLQRGRVTPGAFIRMVQILRSERPDVVQTWLCHADLLGGVAARLSGVNTVFWGIRNTLIDPAKAPASTVWVVRICAWLSRWIPTRIVSCSGTASLEHSRIGYDARRMVVIPNGIDLRRFHPDPDARARVRAEFGIADDDFLFGMVARCDPQKDHLCLIEALAGLDVAQPWKCLLVGRDLGSLEPAIRSAGLASRIILAGPRNDVAAVINAMDVHVLSSAYGEGFPNAVAEAMACGIPCVATRVGDAGFIVGETGWLVAPRDPHALTGAMAAAVAESATPAWISRKTAALERVQENFQLPKMVAAYRAIWQVGQPCPRQTANL